MKPNKDFYEEGEGVKRIEPKNPEPEHKPKQEEPERRIWKVDEHAKEVIELHYEKPHHFKPDVFSSWYYADLREKRPFYIKNDDLIESNGYFSSEKAAKDRLHEMLQLRNDL